MQTNIYNQKNDIKLKISIICCQYNPDFEKIKLTLNSLLKQKYVDLQIVIADDASTNNYFNEIKDFFNAKSFSNYELVGCSKNQGTVHNVFNGLQKVIHDIVKPISPGDLVYGETALYEWAKSMIDGGYDWSISKTIYYNKNENRYKSLQVKAHPRFINCYITKNSKKCFYNYLLFNDIAVGIATIIRTTVLKEYIHEILGRVKYAEDNIYRIMMFDGRICGFYNNNACIYEFGTGVSTQQDSPYRSQLYIDWSEADKIICGRSRRLKARQRFIQFIYKHRFVKRVFNRIFVNKYFMMFFNEWDKEIYTEKIDLDFLNYYNE